MKEGRMRAIALDEVGPPENLRLIQAPIPEVAPDGILIGTEYAGVIYGDAEARRGTYYKETKLPWLPGREVSGAVVAVGSEVTEYRPGDRVVALVMAGGCYADYVLARTRPHQDSHGQSMPPSDVIRLPEGASGADALVYLVNYRLAHVLLHGWARTPPQSRILIHGAAGGMGTMVLTEARRLGHFIIALVRNDAEAEACRQLGADHAIDTLRTDYVEEVLRLTNGEGVRYSFNGVGGDTVNRDPYVIEPCGELHLYGYVAGKTPFDPFLTSRSLSLRTFNADNFIRTPHFAAATEAMLNRFAEGDLLSPGRTFALADAALAHAAMEGGEVIGKIVLQP